MLFGGGACSQWFIAGMASNRLGEVVELDQEVRWLCDRGRAVEARELLDGVYRRFVEGFDTTDLQAARRLLQQLS